MELGLVVLVAPVVLVVLVVLVLIVPVEPTDVLGKVLSVSHEQILWKWNVSRAFTVKSFPIHFIIHPVNIPSS